MSLQLQRLSLDRGIETWILAHNRTLIRMCCRGFPSTEGLKHTCFCTPTDAITVAEASPRQRDWNLLANIHNGTEIDNVAEASPRQRDWNLEWLENWRYSVQGCRGFPSTEGLKLLNTLSILVVSLIVAEASPRQRDWNFFIAMIFSLVWLCCRGFPSTEGLKLYYNYIIDTQLLLVAEASPRQRDWNYELPP